jgi:hypothetical protein
MRQRQPSPEPGIHQPFEWPIILKGRVGVSQVARDHIICKDVHGTYSESKACTDARNRHDNGKTVLQEFGEVRTSK